MSDHANSHDSEHDDLRDQMAQALSRWHAKNAVVCEHSQIVEYGAAADALMADVVQPELDAKDAKIAEAKADAERGWADAQERDDLAATWANTARRFQEAWQAAEKRAAQAEAERDTVNRILSNNGFHTGERGLRAVLSRMRHTEEVRDRLRLAWGSARRGRRDMRQRARQAEAERDRLRAGEDDTPQEDGSWPTPGQFIAKWNSLDSHERLEKAAHLLSLAQRAEKAAYWERRFREECAAGDRLANDLVSEAVQKWKAAAARDRLRLAWESARGGRRQQRDMIARVRDLLPYLDGQILSLEREHPIVGATLRRTFDQLRAALDQSKEPA